MISDDWMEFCRRGRIPLRNQVASVERCVSNSGIVKGHYSDLILDPTLPETHALYPSHDHTVSRSDHSQMVVDARIINDMKSILNETEFWNIIEHLYAVGLSKGKIPRHVPQRKDEWRPLRDYA